jgi:hypothetical protein
VREDKAYKAGGAGGGGGAAAGGGDASDGDADMAGDESA